MPVNQVYFYPYKTKKKGQLWYYTYIDENNVKRKCRGFPTKRDAKIHYQATFGINPDEAKTQTRQVFAQEYIKTEHIQEYIKEAIARATCDINANIKTDNDLCTIVPFVDILDYYLEHIEKTGAKATHCLYKACKNTHLKMFTSLNMNEVTRKLTKQWRDDNIKNGVGYAAINNSIKFARAAINYAIEDSEYDFKFDINKNPFAIKFALKPYKDKEHLTLEEAFFMLQKCLEKFGFSWFFVFLVLAAFTGMRQGEIFGLDVENIDFKNNIIKVRQQYTKGELKDKLKTESSYRDVDIFPFIVSILKSYIRKERIFSGALLKGDRLNNRISRSYMGKKYWKPLLIACEFQNKAITPHTLRACFTDFCLEENIDDKFVQGMLGHSSITTTKNIYAKKTKKMSENYKNKMQEVCNEFTKKLNWNF